MIKFSKKITLVVVLASLVLTACGATQAAPTRDPMIDALATGQAQIQTQLANPTPTVVVLTVSPELIATPVPTTIPVVPSAPVFTGAHGQVASDQPTNTNGYQASPIGGLTSSLPMLCETWGPVPEGGNKGFVVTVPAGAIMWEQKHFGGTCWWVDPADLDNAVQRSVTNITNRDGVAPQIVLLPADNFPLLGCLQTKPVENSVRYCDAVGDQPAFDAPVQLPAPGYFTTP